MRPLIIWCVVATTVLSIHTQHITVTGEFVCQFGPEKDVEVQLWEADTVDEDDYLSTVRSTKNGTFSINGSTDEISTIEPYLIISTSCNAHEVNLFRYQPIAIRSQKFQGCVRTYKVTVPKEFVGKTYDMGKIQLQVPHENEKVKCTGGKVDIK